MATARDYCIKAANRAGILGDGEDASQEMIGRLLNVLNMLFSKWNSEGLLKYVLASSEYTTSSSAISIGPSGDITVSPRPKYVTSVTYSSGEDEVPLTLMMPSDYVKATPNGGGTPCYFSYFADTPNGSIKLLPTPSGSYTYTVWYKTSFSTYGLNDTVTVPNEYEYALQMRLGSLAAVEYGFPREDLNGLANEAEKLLKQANVDMPLMELDSNLLENGVSLYGG